MHIGYLLFPGVQPLDLVGPFDVFAQFSEVSQSLIWRDMEPIAASGGLCLIPSHTFEACPALDVLCIPGGSGVEPLMEDAETLAFIRRQAQSARYLTSVCTGALLLGAAGLLRGKQATTHWAYHHLLEAFGAIPVHERVVLDDRLVTGGGVTAGIDFALVLAAQAFGVERAQRAQLALEYEPAPPFSGHPDTAIEAVSRAQREAVSPSVSRRAAVVARAAARLASNVPG